MIELSSEDEGRTVPAGRDDAASNILRCDAGRLPSLRNGGLNVGCLDSVG